MAPLRASHRIACRRGRERKEIGWIDVIFEHAEMSRWHGEAIVEAALAATRDVNERAVEDRSAVLIHVQTSQQHRLNEAA
jgi:hypothetical protein